MSITREEIAALCAAHDRLLAEHASEPIESPPVSETGDAGLVYKDFDNNAVAAAATEAQDWSGWQAWLDGHLHILREEMLDGVAEFVVTMLNRERAAYDRKLADLRAENAEIKGMVGTLLRLYAGETKADILDLANRRSGNAA